MVKQLPSVPSDPCRRHRGILTDEYLYKRQKVMSSLIYQNFRLFFTASRLISWMCSVSGMSFGQTSVHENWV